MSLKDVLEMEAGLVADRNQQIQLSQAISLKRLADSLKRIADFLERKYGDDVIWDGRTSTNG